MKKRITMCLMAILLIGLLGGCSLFDNESGSSKDEKKIEESKDSKKDKKKKDKEEKKDKPAKDDPVDKPGEDEPENPGDNPEDEPEVKEGLRDMFAYNVSGDYEEIPVFFATATSWLDADKDYYKYHPDLLYDHDPATAYVEGVDGDGIGQMVRFHFGYGYEDQTYLITRIDVLPGYQKSEATYRNNSRPLSLEFHYSDGTMTWVPIAESYKPFGKPIEVRLKQPVLTSECTMVITDAVTGEKYDDCCISEVTFYTQESDGMMYSERSAGEGLDTASFVIEAYSEGEEFWSYTTNNPLTELTCDGAYITSRRGRVYVYDDGKIVALDGLTGNVLWENDEINGYPSAWDFNAQGSMFVCGSYGPDCMVINSEGRTLFRADKMDNNECIWPSMLIVNKKYNEGNVSIYFSQCDENEYFGKIESWKLDVE